MSIRSVDFQVLIPKAPEVQKIKHMELENYKINQQINITQDSIKKSQDLKRINKSDKTYSVVINRDEEKKKKRDKYDKEDKNNRKNDKKEKNERNNYYYAGSKIDIKI